MEVSVMGLGFVGGSMKKSFEIKGIKVIGYGQNTQCPSSHLSQFSQASPT